MNGFEADVVAIGLLAWYIHWRVKHPRRYRRLQRVGRMTYALRNEVYRRWGRRCVYCGSTIRVEVDHVRPKAAGGLPVLENLLPLCFEHNRVKSNYWPGLRYRPWPGFNNPRLAHAILQRELQLIGQAA
jgi:5-methylcytosine-specific restriction endonuclease McrA